MADKIRHTIEKCIPDLLALQRRKIFTQDQIKDILTRREQFEYILQRRTHGLKDYMQLLDYEYTLERQRRQKCDELKLKKQTQRDFAIIKRIINIWDRIMNKYRYNIELWKQYLCFCHKIGTKKTFFKVITNALRFNPYCIELWVVGALYEFEIAKNPFKARKIFYQSLKSNSKSPQLWTEYLDFELAFIDMLNNKDIQPSEDADFVAFQENPMDTEGEEVPKELQTSAAKLSGIRTVIQLAQENCEDIKLYATILTILKKHQQNELYLEFQQEFKQKLEQSLTNTDSISQYIQITITTQEQVHQYIEQYNQQVPMILELIKWISTQTTIDKNAVLKQLIEYPALINDVIILKELISLDLVNSQDKQVFINIVKNNINLSSILKYELLSKIGASEKDITQTMNNALLELRKLNNKDEITRQLLLILQHKGDNKDQLFTFAKVNLLSNKQCFKTFLDAYYPKVKSHKQIGILSWLVQQKQFCPFDYHIKYLESQKLTVQAYYVHLMKLIEMFPEGWEFLIKYVKTNYAEKSSELLNRINCMDNSMRNNILQIYMNYMN